MATGERSKPRQASSAACSRPADTTAPNGQAGAGRHSWTRPGVLRFSTLGDPDTLNPLLGQYQVDVDISMFWAGYLFNYNDQNELVPELATEVPTLANGGIAKDGRTITFHLRRGVQWQDGAPFSADDVLFTFHVLQDLEYVQPGADSWRQVGVGVGAPDQVVFNLRAPSAAFPLTLRIGIIAKHLFAGMSPPAIALS